jgi:uncharacterized membrane protein YgdD (TMEM256/DUF423 family)
MKKQSMLVRKLLVIAGISGFMAVAIGAFGAHALKSIISPDLRAVFETGNKYHFYHSLAAIFCLLLWIQLKLNKLIIAAILFLTGIFLFSGSLYILAVTGVKGWGVVTPFGGILYLLGWGFFIWSIRKWKIENEFQ